MPLNVPGWLIGGAVVLAIALLIGGFGLTLWLVRRKPAKTPAAQMADAQDPLPESNWLFRRILVFASGAVRTIMIGCIIAAIAMLGRGAPAAGIDGLVAVAIALTILIALDHLLYLVAPSGEQVAKWLATISALKGGISLRRGAVQTPDGAAAASEATPAATRQAAPSPEE